LIKLQRTPHDSAWRGDSPSGGLPRARSPSTVAPVR
jgi:hypothetical protein